MSDVPGYDSVAASAVEWRRIVPESPGFRGAIGSYANGAFANTTAAKEAFPLAVHVVYDVTGGFPTADVLDIEPRDAVLAQASGWSREHNLAVGNTLALPGLYSSAADVSAVVSVMLDSGWKRSQFLVHSAHYTGRAHICGPDACGFPQADGTQYADKGLHGQNTDLNVFAAHFFRPPRPDPDARYGLFDNVKRSLINGTTERATVREYDRWRAMQTTTKHPHRVRLALLRARLRLLYRRLDRVMAGEKTPTANQAWRLRELRDRMNGMRLV